MSMRIEDTANIVLTNRALFSLMVSFLDGLPWFALDFGRRHRDLVSTQWRTSGMLPYQAITVDDMAMLARFYRLYKEQCEKDATPDPRLAFDSTMIVAAEQGKMKILQWLHEHTAVQCSPTTLAFAATMGRFEVVEWLVEHRPEACVSVTTTPCDAIVLTGDLKLIRLMMTQFPSLKLTANAMDYAAAHGHEDILRFLHETREEGCTSDAMDHAARCGRLDIVEFLHVHRHEGCTSNAMDFAAANGHLDVVQFLHTHRTEGCTAAAMDDAARNGHFTVVKYLQSHRREGTIFAMDMAAAHGHLEIVDFLHRHEHHGTPLGMIAAAEAGHLDVVTFLHQVDENEHHCSGDALHGAAQHGRTDVIAFLVRHCAKGCLVTARSHATTAGHTKVVTLLDAFIDPDSAVCSERDHEWGAVHRRCQKDTQNEIATAW